MPYSPLPPRIPMRARLRSMPARGTGLELVFGKSVIGNAPISFHSQHGGGGNRFRRPHKVAVYPHCS